MTDIYSILGRSPIVYGRESNGEFITGNTVLVTGAGGSIGSEICRQIAFLRPRMLLLFDQSEFNLFSIDAELGERWPSVDRRAIIGSVQDDSTARVIPHYAPDVVINAAALKHVGLVEANPYEAILTNVGGVHMLLEALPPHVLFVQISTDKAVHPTSIMGATKRLAEILAMHTRIVRLGNVFASSGSIGSIFDRQIAAGGPVTITDERMKRYFMTAEEAAGVALDALSVPLGSVVVPDITEIAIVDIARRMIGDRPIPIAYTTPLPSEKLHEELFYPNEFMKRHRLGHFVGRVETQVGVPASQFIETLLGRARVASDVAIRDMFREVHRHE